MGMANRAVRYTVDDLDNFPDDGNRYELVDGELLVTPAPKPPHQGIAANLFVMLVRAGVVPDHAAFRTPGAIVLRPRTQLEPDALVVPPRFSDVEEWTDITEHWLAVEILSRSSRKFDREIKRDRYLEIGVREVWLIDRRDRTVEVCRATGAGIIVRDIVHWHVPTTDLIVDVDVSALIGKPRAKKLNHP